MMRNKYVVMAEETSAEAPPAATGSAPAPATGSMLSQAGAAGNAGNDWLPEKYRVTKEDGAVDVEASARKLADSYAHLEKRLGSGDVPPKTAEEYDVKLEVEGFDWSEFKDDPVTQDFIKGAHEKGMTNAQLEFVIGSYLKAGGDLVTGAQALDVDQVKADLRTAWPTDAEVDKNLGLAHKAFMSLATPEDQARVDEIGDSPVVLRILAKVGQLMQEDTPISSSSQPSGADFAARSAELRAELEKLPPSDPRRKQIRDQLDELYTKKYGSQRQVLTVAAASQSRTA
jgi:hypothetical protein